MKAQDVARLADAYRATMAEGDRTFGPDSFEQKLLHGLVTESASHATYWIETRVDDGHNVSAPLRDFLGVVQDADTVGQAMARLRKGALDQGKAILKQLLIAGTLPIWLATAGACLVAGFGFAHRLGVSIGTGIVAILASGVALSRAAPIIARGPAVVAGMGRAVSDTYIRSLSQARGVGARAQSVFESAAAPRIAQVYESEGATPQSNSLLRQLRGMATGFVAVAWGALAIALVVVAFGIWEGISTSTSQVPVPGLPPLHLPSLSPLFSPFP